MGIANVVYHLQGKHNFSFVCPGNESCALTRAVMATAMQINRNFDVLSNLAKFAVKMENHLKIAHFRTYFIHEYGLERTWALTSGGTILKQVTIWYVQQIRHGKCDINCIYCDLSLVLVEIVAESVAAVLAILSLRAIIGPSEWMEIKAKCSCMLQVCFTPRLIAIVCHFGQLRYLF